MNQKLDFKKSVSELVSEYPQVKDIMAGLGFQDIVKPLALSTVGKVMTVPRGASIKGISMSEVLDAFRANGFEVEEDGAEPASAATAPRPAAAKAGSPEERTELLKSYVARLSAGEDLAAVREDFVRNFQSVDAAEIARAEQSLIQGGTKIADVQRLCDVHSALFHGATREEQIANAEAAVTDALHKQSDGEATARKFAEIPGHPLSVFTAENDRIAALLQEVMQTLRGDADDKTLAEKAEALRVVTVHYARKGDLLYPLLNRTYDFSGPSNVMWGVDDEIRDELKLLAGDSLPDRKNRLEKAATRAQEMVYKENNILYPLCIQKFSQEDWMRIYYEMPAYDTILTGGCPVWEAAEARRAELKTVGGKIAGEAGAAAETDGMIPLGSGHMTPRQILAVLNTIPMELSFVDENNLNRFFNDGDKLFKRPDMAIDREVFSCHPPKYEAMVRQIIESFRTGAQDSVDVWMNKGGEPVLVRYMAVRESGNYVGTLECVQKMKFAQEHFRA